MTLAVNEPGQSEYCETALDKAVVQYLAEAFTEHSIQYCFPSPSRLAQHCEIAEIGVFIHRRQVKEAARIVMGLRQLGLRPVADHETSIGCRTFDFGIFEANRLRWVRIRLLQGLWSWGVSLISSEDLLNHTMRSGRLWILSPTGELSYLVAKMATSEKLSPEEATCVSDLVSELGHEKVGAVLHRVFGNYHSTALMDRYGKGGAQLNLSQVAGALLQGLKHLPTAPFIYISHLLRRVLKRSRFPRGVALVLLGPDGVGKSTLRKNITAQIGSIFPVHAIWYRPRILGRRGPGRPSHQPHAKSPRGRIASVLYVLTVFLDCWAGHWFHTRGHLKELRLVIFDRHFFDLLIDPRRYRYGGPMRLSRALSKLVPPKEFLMIVLDAPEDVVLARKQELPRDEIRRQRRAYRNLNPAHAIRINTDAPTEQCTQSVVQLVFNYLAERFAREHHAELVAS